MKRNVAVLMILLVFVAACGSRITDEQRALVEAGGDANGDGETVVGGAIVVGSGGDSSTDTTAPADGAAAGGDGAAAGGEGAAAGGDGAAAGGDGAAAGGGSTCTGGGASDTGVTDKEIKIGNVSTISGPVPGFGQTAVNAVKAYVAFTNATGGVCGRQLSLVTADDRLQSGTNKSETDKLAKDVIGFVGGNSVVDDGSAQSLAGTNIVDVSIGISDAKVKSPNNFPTNPIDLADGGNGALAILKYLKQSLGISKAGLVYPAQASAKARIFGYQKDLERAGFEIALLAEVAVTETNYAGVASNIEAKGVEVLLTTLEISGMANLAKAMQQNGYFPKVPFYGAQAYGKTFITQAGAAAEATVLGLAYNILEDAASVPAMKDLLTWYTRTNPGSEVDFFAIQSWAAADMYVSALKASAGPPTRDTVLAHMKGLTSFNAHGLIAAVNPAQKKGAGCFIIAEVNSGKWVRTHPATATFDCSFT